MMASIRFTQQVLDDLQQLMAGVKGFHNYGIIRGEDAP